MAQQLLAHGALVLVLAAATGANFYSYQQTVQPSIKAYRAIRWYVSAGLLILAGLFFFCEVVGSSFGY